MIARGWMAALAAALSAVGGGAVAAEDYPARPVRWVVPFAPGASNDIVARLVAGKLSESLGQQFVVDNRGGAGGAVGAEIVARAAPDGYTLLSANPGPNINNVMLRKNAPYKFDSFAPIVFFGYAPLIIVANPRFAPNTAPELVAYAKGNPGKLVWATSGIGSSLHIGLALFQGATGIEVTHVPYKGTAPAFTDLIGGSVNAMYTTSVSADAHLKAKRLKALAIAAKKRSSVLPNLPTLEEQGIKDAEAIVWFGLAAPAGTPQSIVARLNAESNKALQAPDAKKRLDQLGLEIGGGSVQDFVGFMDNEAARLRKLIQAGIIAPY